MRTISALVLSGVLCCSIAAGCGDDDYEVPEVTTDAGASSSGSGTPGSSSSSGAPASSSSSGAPGSSSSSGNTDAGQPDAESTPDASIDDADAGEVGRTIGGTVTGLAGTGLVLQNRGGDDLGVDRDGAFVFSTKLAAGTEFAVTVRTQPVGPAQSCTVSGATGTVAGGDVTTVTVNCATDRFVVGGTVSGLRGGGLVLQNNGGDNALVEGNGTFAFDTTLADLSPYAVTVLTQPASQTCVLSNPSGTIASADVTDIAIVCTDTSRPVSGVISGLLAGESAVVRNNGGDPLTLDENEAFVFPTEVAVGSPYAVTVTAPAGKTCSVSNGAGTIVVAGAAPQVTIQCGPFPASCQAIKTAAPASADGNYTIDPDGLGAFAPLSVFCDMTTDGGGYTSYPIENGISTSRASEANSCQAVGLQLAVARTNAHLQALYAKYGSQYFQTVTGVTGLAAGNYTNCAMNSGTACGANWRALDNGSWFARGVAITEPNGDYVPGCWLTASQGIDAFGVGHLNDLSCEAFTGPRYVCSDNAKDPIPQIP